MNLYGSLKELVAVVFRNISSGKQVTLRENQTATYSADRDVQTPQEDANSILVSRTSTDTLTNKTLTGPVINSPTGITKADVGLGNVDNTSDATKNAATATLTNKTLTSPVINSPTGIVKGDVGLGNVDNTSDATKNSAVATLTNKTLTSPVINSPTGIVKGDVGLGNVDNTSDATKNAAAVTLTNKTLTGAVISDYEEFTQISTPSAPASGKNRIYSKSDKKFYNLDSTGLETQIGAGSSGGEESVVFNPNDAGAGWTSTGAGVTLATSTTTSDLPLGSAASGALTPISSTSIKITPVSGTSDYVYYRWTMPAALKSRKLKCQWEQKPLSGYAAGDLSLSVYTNSTSAYNGTATRLPLSTDSSSVTGIPANTGRFVTTFDATGTDDYYEIRILRAAGTTALNLAAVIIGPGVNPQGAVVGAWTSYTMTIGGTSSAPAKGTIVLDKARYRRVGDSMEIEYDFEQSSAGSAGSGEYLFSVPSGYTIDSSVQVSGSEKAVGFGKFSNAAGGLASVSKTVVMSPYSSFTQLRAHTPQTSSNNLTNTSQTVASGGDFDLSGSRIIFSFRARVPIAEWTGSGTVNVVQNDVEYASNSGTWDATDSTSFVYGPAGRALGGTLTAARTKRVRFLTPIQPTDVVELQFSENQSVWYSASAGRLNNLIVMGPTLDSGGVYVAGVTVDNVSGSATDIDIAFAQYRTIANDDLPTADWPSTNAYWRVIKYKAGQPVGFASATTTALGLVKIPQSSVIVTGGNGFGGSSSGDTAIRNFTTATVTGGDLSYTPRTTTAGDFITVNTAGNYLISINDLNGSSSMLLGVSQNTTQTSTNIDSLTNRAENRGIGSTPAANLVGNLCVPLICAVGDKIRAHYQTGVTGQSSSDPKISLTMQRVL